METSRFHCHRSHTGVRTGCHYLINLSVCVCVTFVVFTDCELYDVIINMSSWVPRIWIEVWVGTYDRIWRPVNRYVPKIPPFQGGENVICLLYTSDAADE